MDISLHLNPKPTVPPGAQQRLMGKRQPIHYARGKSIRDAHPENRRAADFTEFAELVLNDRAKAKGLQYFCAAFKADDKGVPRRGKDYVQPTQFVALDFDGFSDPESFNATIAALQRFQGFAYTTASHTPEAPRARAVLCATREMDRAERLRVSLAVQDHLNRKVGEGLIQFDESVYKAEQPLFTPPVDAITYHFRGVAVDVDKLLTEVPEAEAAPGPRAKTEQTTNERAESTATDDPVLIELQRRGMVKKQIDPARFAVVCPCEGDHTAESNETATAYMLPNFNGVKYGKFNCMHAHCENRPQEQFLEALGLDPKKVWPEQRGERSGPEQPAGGTQAEPLEIDDTPAAPYPVDALGPILGGAARVLNHEIQAPMSMCGQSVLVAGSMCAQGLFDVEPPHGRPHPISLNALDTGDSGDRKSTVDREASEPITAHERELEEVYVDEMEDYRNQMDAYQEARKAAISEKKKKGRAAIALALDNLGPEPEAPRKPFLVCEDPTVEGIYRSLNEGRPSQGCFTDEGGLLIGGHALNAENFIKTISRLSKLWDGAPFDRTRGGDERNKLSGRRMSLHWMIQPQVAAELFSRKIAEAQGFFPRCLLAIPETLAGTREYKRSRVHNRPEMGTYYAALTRLLQADLPLRETGGGLAPRVLTMTEAAQDRYAEFFNHYERQNGPGGELAHLMPFVSRIAEQGLRIAAVLCVVEQGTDATTVDVDTLNNGLRLAEFSLQEWDRLKRKAAITTAERNADSLLRWAREHGGKRKDGKTYIYGRHVQQFGPNAVREKAARDDAIAVLEDHGWLIPIKGGTEIDGRHRRHVWEVVTNES